MLPKGRVIFVNISAGLFFRAFRQHWFSLALRFAWALGCAALLGAGGDFPTDRALQETGTIQGVVESMPVQTRRVADRYPGSGGAVRAVQEIPAVAFIIGEVAGISYHPPAIPPQIAQEDTAFVPGLVVIPVGATVEFPNHDPFFHNVFSYSSPARFDLGRYPQGESKIVRFDEPGLVKVYCEVHEFMRAAILVTENPFFSLVDDGGSFSIQGVPAGSYELYVWHADVGGKQLQVVVRAGVTTRLTVDLS